MFSVSGSDIDSITLGVSLPALASAKVSLLKMFDSLGTSNPAKELAALTLSDVIEIGILSSSSN